MTLRFFWMIVRALFELLRYDVVNLVSGFSGVYCSLRTTEQNHRAVAKPEIIKLLTQANSIALSLYWKPAACLQRSMAQARVMRSYGVNAEVVIGCQLQPFFGHAWVEVDGKVINDSQAYRRMLYVFDRV